jgi:hypothetical protein
MCDSQGGGPCRIKSTKTKFKGTQFTGAKQIRAKIAVFLNQLDSCKRGHFVTASSIFIEQMRQLSAVQNKQSTPLENDWWLCTRCMVKYKGRGTHTCSPTVPCLEVTMKQ